MGLDHPQSLLSLTDLKELDDHDNATAASSEDAIAIPPLPPVLSSSLFRICRYPVEEETTIINNSMTSEQPILVLIQIHRF